MTYAEISNAAKQAEERRKERHPHKGVYQVPSGNYKAQTQLDGKTKYIGTYATHEEAQEAVNTVDQLARQVSELQQQCSDANQRIEALRSWIKAANQFAWVHERGCPRRETGEEMRQIAKGALAAISATGKNSNT
jgi:hypothetical protein